MELQATRPPLNVLGVLFRHKKKCFLIPLLLAAAAAIAAAFLPPSYEAKAIVSVVNVDFGVNQMNMRGAPVRDIAWSFRSGALIDEVFTRFRDRLAACGRADRPSFPDAFDVVAARDSSIIEIRVTLPDATLAADVATSIANVGGKNYVQELRESYSRMIADLQRQTNEDQAGLDKAELALKDFRIRVKLESLLDRLSVQRTARSRWESRLAEIEVELAAQQGLIDSYDKALAAQPPTIELKRSIARDNELQQAAAREAGKGVQDLLGLGLTDTVLNPTYTRIQQELLQARAKESSLTAERLAVGKAKAESDRLLAELQETVAARSAELAALTFRLEQAQTAARTSCSKLSDKQTIGMWPPQNVSVIPADPPQRPAWPNRTLIALTTFLGAFVLTWLVAMLIERRRAAATG